jgi:hypothetical protein
MRTGNHQLVPQLHRNSQSSVAVRAGYDRPVSRSVIFASLSAINRTRPVRLRLKWKRSAATDADQRPLSARNRKDRKKKHREVLPDSMFREIRQQVASFADLSDAKAISDGLLEGFHSEYHEEERHLLIPERVARPGIVVDKAYTVSSMLTPPNQPAHHMSAIGGACLIQPCGNSALAFAADALE